MRVRDADDLALVLEHQHVIHLRPAAQVAVLLLPGRQQGDDLLAVQLGERHVVPGRVADHPGDPFRGPIAVDPRRGAPGSRGAVGPTHGMSLSKTKTPV